jgi:hypothetical protein
MFLAETILLLRLMTREEIRLEQQYGERFRIYTQRVPRLLPSLGPRVEEDGQLPSWSQALWEQAFQWGFVAMLVAFACTLSDPIGYTFAAATIGFLILQKLVCMLGTRLEHT